MLAAAHLDNFLFLLFIAVAIFFQLLTRVANKGRRSGDGGTPPGRGSSASAPQAPRSPTRPSEETDEDRIREFLEALGQPTSSKPPPPVVRRPTYQKPVVLPHVGPFGSPLPPLTSRPPDLPPEISIPRRVTPPPQRKVFQPTSEVPAFEVHESPPPLAPITEAEVVASPIASPQSISKPVETKTNIRTLLTTSSGLRDAIILREIFGPPRSLQPLDLVGNV